MELLEFVQEPPSCVKVNINVHNVYGWSTFYYNNASYYKQKPEKKSFFEELRNPIGTLVEFIKPWTGKETDFKYIMDMLNDPMTQKKLGAFYTPPEYAKLAVGLVKKAIQRALDAGKSDYIILDRCAGTGNLEMYLDDGDEDILSHVIVSTYELKEWMVLKDRFGGRVRYIIPPIPANKNDLPALTDDGFLSGANALTRDIIDNPVVMQYVNNPDCAIILFENPPYIETTSIEFQKRGEGAEATAWKDNYIVAEMKKEVSGAASNDMANIFIWSAFKFFLRQDSDSYIVFSPVKYYKSQHIIKKKFIEGYAFNRVHFHAKTDACIMCAYWSNETDTVTKKITLKAINLDENKKYINEGTIDVKKVFKRFSDGYYDTTTNNDDKFDGIACELNGTCSSKSNSQIRSSKLYNENMIGYLVANQFGFDNPRLNAIFTRAGAYGGNGFYIRSHNFMEKLPLFAASRYTDHVNNWKVMSMIMKSADRDIQYRADVQSGKLELFLFRTLFWTCMSHYPHIRSLRGSDGRLYLNQICLDGNTLAKEKFNDFISKGYTLTKSEQKLLDKMENLLKMVKECDEYNSMFNYGLYQIDEEINIKIQTGVKSDGSPKMDFKYGDINNLVKEIKSLAKQYYVDNLIDTLFDYEFLK